MRFRLRDFESDDFHTLHALDQACFPPGISYSRRELAFYLSARGVFTTVAETESKQPQIAGFIVAQKRPSGIGHVVTIDTDEKYRRHGLGSLLMKSVEDRLRDAGCHGMVLETAVDNAAAIAFYKRLDYSILKTIPHYYQGRLDAYVMIKQLK